MGCDWAIGAETGCRIDAVGTVAAGGAVSCVDGCGCVAILDAVAIACLMTWFVHPCMAAVPGCSVHDAFSMRRPASVCISHLAAPAAALSPPTANAAPGK